ncbi:MAG: RNA 2',3'-cyclic phosphodiesterase [Nitrosomonadales bacterium]|nr:RNA 2',3'-cyclic phosphodiesterase [Nitrosomonadales bacterium]
MERIEKEASRRLFFALWPNDAGRAALAAWQAPLRDSCGGSLMRRETLHATLVFLGEVAEPRMESLLLAAQETHARRFELKLTAAHYWGHNHLVYAAPETTPPPLAELVRELEHNLRRHRFRFEDRPYKPHVTLLRHAKWSDEAMPPMPAVRWPVGDFVLVQSLSDEQGARYEVLARFGASE